MKILAGVAVLVALTFAGSAASHTTGVTCNGQIVKIFDNTNGNPVVNGAKPPLFTTKGAYCVTSIGTYHWNGGKGAPPGTLGLTRASVAAGFPTEGPFPAKGSPGQNGAPNVNWQATLSTSSSPTVIDGTYACKDSSPSTWSANTAGGAGFCIVYGIPAQGVTPPPAAPAAPKASAKLVVEPDGRVELIVKDLGTTPITMVRFRAHNWFIEKLGAVQQKGICTLDRTDQMVCESNFSIEPEKSIPFTITQSAGPNDGGYVWVGGSQLHIVVDGPAGSPPSTPPPVTEKSRAEKAIDLIDYAIAAERRAQAEIKAKSGAERTLGESEFDLKTAADHEIDNVEALDDAEAEIRSAESIDHAGVHRYQPGFDASDVETAIKHKVRALVDLRNYVAKKR